MEKLNKKRLNKIIELLDMEEYQAILDMLRTKDISDKKVKTITLLIEKLISISTTGVIPQKTNPKKVDPNDILSLIEDNIFLKLENKIKSEPKTRENEGAMHQKYNYIIRVLISRIKMAISRTTTLENAKNDQDIKRVMEAINARKIAQINRAIRTFFNQQGIKSSKYEILILNLAKIYYRQKNNLYEEIQDILCQLKYGVYEFDVTFYLQRLCLCIKSRNDETAALYLEILQKCCPSKLLSPDTFQQLEQAIALIRKEKETLKEEMKNFLLEQIDASKDSGSSIILLETPIEKKQRDMIYQIIRENPGFGVRALSIGEEPKRLVLRVLELDSRFRINDVKDHYQLYLTKKYQEYIDITTAQLRNPNSECHRADLYAYLGLSYYHLGNKKEAIKCLTIAIEFEKRFGLEPALEKEIRELLRSIKGTQTTEVNSQDKPQSDYQRQKEQEKETFKTIIQIALEKLQTTGASMIYLDEPMTKQVRKQLYKIIKEEFAGELKPYSIGNEPKRVILRHLDKKRTIPGRLENYIKLYDEEEYEECITAIRSMLFNPEYKEYEPLIFAYLASAYYMAGNGTDCMECMMYMELAESMNAERKYPCYKTKSLLENISRNRANDNSLEKIFLSTN